MRRIIAVVSAALFAVGAMVGFAPTASAVHTSCATQYSIVIPNVPGSITASHCWNFNSAHTAVEPHSFRIVNNTGRGLTVGLMRHSFYPGGNVTSSNESMLDAYNPDAGIAIGESVSVHWGGAQTFAVYSGCPTFRVKVIQTTDTNNTREVVGRIRINPPVNC